MRRPRGRHENPKEPENLLQGAGLEHKTERAAREAGQGRLETEAGGRLDWRWGSYRGWSRMTRRNKLVKKSPQSRAART